MTAARGGPLMPETRSVAIMQRHAPSTIEQLRRLQAAWGVPGRPMSAASVVAEAIRRADEAEARAKARGK
jgi:hypothetical protein